MFKLLVVFGLVAIVNVCYAGVALAPAIAIAPVKTAWAAPAAGWGGAGWGGAGWGGAGWGGAKWAGNGWGDAGWGGAKWGTGWGAAPLGLGLKG
ncbi:PREDICTED: vicilin-like seed storage protein At2g28490 [Trachymyrmex septentrionalis]|uniref:vicilin-like seed storage protein At2g28490 n=1 Tax=Trachymyrmex septentrionalis TaxID=34720 RepID=UPI00084F8516|nr:PREDICTED: vicilin-like seed storage protein At2g28490 [Trachymyrmex septentrionalis]